MPDAGDAAAPGGPRFGRPPVLHAFGLAVALLVLVIGGSVTFGAWGEFDARLAVAYIIPAVLLHAWSTWDRTASPWARIGAWLLLLAMCVHTGVLLRPAIVGTIGLLAALDILAHRTRLPQVRASTAARVVAGGAVIACAVGITLLVALVRFEPAVRVGASVVLATALTVAAALQPRLREPAILLPALGVHYLAFVLLAAPVIPIGPAVAWWVLCCSVFIGVAVAARHVSGPGVPPGRGRHQHVERALPDAAIAPYAADVERFLETGAGGRALSERIERASGRRPTGTTLPGLVTAASRGTYPSRADRERALNDFLEVQT